MRLKGPTAAQSSVFALLDRVLSVEQPIDEPPGAFLQVSKSRQRHGKLVQDI